MIITASEVELSIYLVLSFLLFNQKVSNVIRKFLTLFEFSRCLVFSEFVFYFIFLNCRLVMVFTRIWYGELAIRPELIEETVNVLSIL